MKKKVGIITYHSAYNFGSVLQAYATQWILEKLDCEAVILNYRMKSQYEYYSMLHTNQGIKVFVKDLLHLPQIKKYIKRKNRFEEFIASLKLTNEFSEPKETNIFRDKFDIFVSGSDQIWNKHSNELNSVDWNYMDPYLLDFTDRKKISYASSIVNMTQDELKRIAPKIEKFDYVSFRESESCTRLMEVSGVSSQAVIDPTLLLNKEDWMSMIGEIPEELKHRKYVLYYALDGIKKTAEILPKLQDFAESKGCLLVMITPLAYFVANKKIYNMIEAGPKEFLGLIDNAEVVLTNSYHGTLFSVNLGKEFYTLRDPNSKDQRITSILKNLGLSDRIVASPENITRNSENINYDKVWKMRDVYRNKSIEYLKNAIADSGDLK